jgi:UDP-N-acetyl-D-glucosamine dehydrogenase
VLGVAYKKDTSDIRESPALDIMKLLHEKGGEISYHDPYVSQISFNNQVLYSIPLTAQSLSSCDVVVVVSDHSMFNAREVVDHSRLVIDARNLTQGIDSKKIVRL